MASKAQESVNCEWNAMAGEWDDLAAPYRDAFVKLLWEQTGLESSDERTVVDFGCGTGLLTESLRQQSQKSNFVCVDAAPSMVKALKEKIRGGEWKNIRAHGVSLAHSEAAGDDVQKDLELLKGQVDLVVASSVMTFVPSEDLPATMKAIGELLKPGGVFCHSDWPKSEENPEGFTNDKASEMYGLAGLTTKSMIGTKVGMGSHEGDVFVGVAVKPAN